MDPLSMRQNQFDPPHPHFTPFNSYLKSQHLFKNYKKITNELCDPGTSWEVQRYFKKMMSNPESSEIDLQLVCTERGYITDYRDWGLPKFKEVKAHKMIEHIHQGLAYESQNLIEDRHCIESPPSMQIIEELFIVAQKINIPWKFSKKCCQGNVHYLYNTFLAMGIPSFWMKIHYYFGKQNFHAALSIKDTYSNDWIIDPSFAQEPMSKFRWTQHFVGNQTLPTIGTFPFEAKFDKCYLFLVDGNELLKFNDRKNGIIDVFVEPSVKSIRAFAKNFSECIIENTLLAEVIKHPPPNAYLLQEEAIVKINRFVQETSLLINKNLQLSMGNLLLLPMPEDIDAIQGHLLLNKDEISIFANEYPFKKLIDKRVQDVIQRSKIVHTNLKTCLKNIIKLKFSEKQIKMMDSSVNNTINSILRHQNEFHKFVNELQF